MPSPVAVRKVRSPSLTTFLLGRSAFTTTKQRSFSRTHGRWVRINKTLFLDCASTCDLPSIHTETHVLSIKPPSKKPLLEQSCCDGLPVTQTCSRECYVVENHLHLSTNTFHENRYCQCLRYPACQLSYLKWTPNFYFDINVFLAFLNS